MIIVGFDPGLATLGYGAIEKNARGQCRMLDFGVVLTPKDENLAVRLCMLEEGSQKSDPFLSAGRDRGGRAVFCQEYHHGHSRRARARRHSADGGKGVRRLYEYTALQIKQALTGYGKADKTQIQQMVKTFLGLPKIPRPDDAADALAVALCHAQTNRFGNLFSI